MIAAEATAGCAGRSRSDPAAAGGEAVEAAGVRAVLDMSIHCLCDVRSDLVRDKLSFSLLLNIFTEKC